MCVGGVPYVFAGVFVLLFSLHSFSQHTLLTVSNVAFLFEHLFTYCVIGSYVKSASLILSHSLLGQFDSVFLKWGNSSCAAYLLYRISLIACVDEAACSADVSQFSFRFGMFA